MHLSCLFVCLSPCLSTFFLDCLPSDLPSFLHSCVDVSLPFPFLSFFPSHSLPVALLPLPADPVLAFCFPFPLASTIPASSFAVCLSTYLSYPFLPVCLPADCLPVPPFPSLIVTVCTCLQYILPFPTSAFPNPSLLTWASSLLLTCLAHFFHTYSPSHFFPS